MKRLEAVLSDSAAIDYLDFSKIVRVFQTELSDRHCFVVLEGGIEIKVKMSANTFVVCCVEKRA